MLARGSPSTEPTGTVDSWMVTSEPPGLWLPEPSALFCPSIGKHVEKQDTGWVIGEAVPVSHP